MHPCLFAARGGEVTVKVPADIADRFNRAVVRPAAVGCPAALLGQAACGSSSASSRQKQPLFRRQPGRHAATLCLHWPPPAPPAHAQNKHADSGEGVGSDIDSETHKSGMEPLTQRARNLTEVAHVGVGWGGEWGGAAYHYMWVWGCRTPCISACQGCLAA